MPSVSGKHTSRRLEETLQPELNLPGRIHRAENLSCIGRKNGGAIASGSVRPFCIGGHREIGPVRDMNHSRAELQQAPVAEWTVLEDREIKTGKVWSDETVAPRVAERAERRRSIGRGMEPASHRSHATTIRARASALIGIANKVWTIRIYRRSRACVVETKHRRKRHVAMKTANAGNRPSFNRFRSPTGGIVAKCFPRPERQFVNEIENQIVAHVEAGPPAIAFTIEQVLRLASFVDRVAGKSAGSVVHRVGPGVVGRESQAVTGAVFKARLHGIIKRLRIRHDSDN